MNNKQREEKLNQFQMLCDNSELFAISVGLVLTFKSLDKGVDEVIEKDRWYAQIADCIIKKSTDSVTDDEKVEFIDLHLKMMGHA
jgi:hypothetical protein